MTEFSQGKLYIVGTPIGNLSDISPRAVETLKKVDFIAAEDTRVSLKLLNHFEIKKPLVSYYQHNHITRDAEIIKRLSEGESCAVVSDAGMPCISDPGEALVQKCIENDIDIVPIPSATAAITALVISGLSTSRFSFEGFLSINKKSRESHLNEVKNLSSTLIFYEAPHKLKNTLADLFSALGNRKISLCRELTKIHEEVIRCSLSEAVNLYEEKAPRGEYVLIIEGKLPEEPKEITMTEAAEMAEELVKNGEKVTNAAKIIAAKTGFSKSEIYNNLISGKE